VTEDPQRLRINGELSMKESFLKPADRSFDIPEFMDRLWSGNQYQKSY
jgi:hypothetical protein